VDLSGSPKTSIVSESAMRAPTRTLEKGLLLLGLFDVDHPEWSLRELRERAGLPKATTRRLMKTLEASGWVALDPASNKYHLGSSVLRAFHLAVSHSELVRIAHPFLVRLTELTTESSNLTVWTYQGPLILDTVLTARLFKPHTFVGMLLPGIASADAQILISFQPEEAWDRILATRAERRTPHTLTDPDGLRERWCTVRREGVALDREEWIEGAPGVAAPVFDQTGQLRAAISIVAPIERCNETEMLRYAAAVKKSAAELSEKLGYRP
jgi:IclR family transcriptional regulator, KDG regulon repressor